MVVRRHLPVKMIAATHHQRVTISATASDRSGALVQLNIKPVKQIRKAAWTGPMLKAARQTRHATPIHNNVKISVNAQMRVQSSKQATGVLATTQHNVPNLLSGLVW